jgi:hypothetical protein
MSSLLLKRRSKASGEREPQGPLSEEVELAAHLPLLLANSDQP